MVDLELESLTWVVDALTNGKGLTPAERGEVLRIARGLACKDSAAAGNVSPETVRARRKRIYRKLAVAGAGEVLSSLLSVALPLVSGAQSGARPQGAIATAGVEARR